jgi:hypothetical protein
MPLDHAIGDTQKELARCLIRCMDAWIDVNWWIETPGIPVCAVGT